MPHWFRKQLMKAFYKKDRSQIRMLNKCWYSYHASLKTDKDKSLKQA